MSTSLSISIKIIENFYVRPEKINKRTFVVRHRLLDWIQKKSPESIAHVIVFKDTYFKKFAIRHNRKNFMGKNGQYFI